MQLYYLPKKNNDDKEDPQQDVANVAPHVVEGTDGPSWVGTLEVVVACVLVTTLIQELEQNIQCQSSTQSSISIPFVQRTPAGEPGGHRKSPLSPCSYKTYNHYLPFNFVDELIVPAINVIGSATCS